MSQPPPIPSQPLNYATDAPPLNVRAIAIRQKAIQLCILAQILLFASRFFTPPAVILMTFPLSLCVAVAAAVFAILLCVELRYPIALAIVLGLVVLIPLIGIITLVVIDNQATSRLRKAGIRVGLLGAKTIPPA